MLDDLVKAGRYLGQTLRLMVGLPEYDAYLSHMEREHPTKIPMSYDEFFRDRQAARYDGQGRGCC
ncbi:YbdD/YjiX family protein [Actimicrobium antarcticum]|uniref:YbdD/YjiX family protein n=1 Tax=Actimicrobium antarcticum TaxID=1051899 RepID=UPI0031DDD73A